MRHHESYTRHNNWYNQHFPSENAKAEHYEKVRTAGKNNIAQWLQQLFFSCLDPLLNRKNQNWLTVGDAYGFDAQYILNSGNDALATDLNTDFLNVALKEGIIKACAAENAEKLSCADNSFDFVLCKESYHHFPRPYAAMYEMIRVARTGVVVIEPQDPIARMPMLLMLNNLFSRNGEFLNKLWKNRFSFEPVGNFVYKVSEREFEKLAAGLGLPMVGFKKINPNYWFKGAESVSTDKHNNRFFMIKMKKLFFDAMVKLRAMPAQVLTTIIFKQLPDNDTIAQLKKSGYHLVHIPKNPYLN
ncbi:class I SAM-dependent methyltransferase [Pedobacter sp. UBA5917]|jgi:ubiquinone/menaquinone biosynthesis C-methylase UbiE|uniref:class I SAM-dependent methyltransferase n=1 Tax=Pedobacter sp. UBA5917 TaxID=1947061 RepID=UPI0025F9DE82|nr:class I SAM-dependent methyltransferase [Pedobacter sp. UBA5917]